MFKKHQSTLFNKHVGEAARARERERDGETVYILKIQQIPENPDEVREPNKFCKLLKLNLGCIYTFYLFITSCSVLQQVFVSVLATDSYFETRMRLLLRKEKLQNNKIIICMRTFRKM